MSAGRIHICPESFFYKQTGNPARRLLDNFIWIHVVAHLVKLNTALILMVSLGPSELSVILRCPRFQVIKHNSYVLTVCQCPHVFKRQRCKSFTSIIACRSSYVSDSSLFDSMLKFGSSSSSLATIRYSRYRSWNCRRLETGQGTKSLPGKY